MSGKLTDRDIRTLGWISSQRGVGITLVPFLLGDPDGPATFRVASRWARRMVGYGLLHRERVDHRTYVFVTRLGAKTIGATPRPCLLPDTPSHHQAVAITRLLLEQTDPEGRWTPEQALTNNLFRRPDGTWSSHGRILAVEVELSRKTGRGAYAYIMGRMHPSVQGVLWFTRAQDLRWLDARLQHSDLPYMVVEIPTLPALPTAKVAGLWAA